MSHAEQAIGARSATAIDGFSHMVLEVKELDRSERFYQDVIGLDLLGRELLAEPRPHSLLRLNTGQLVVLTKESLRGRQGQGERMLRHRFGGRTAVGSNREIGRQGL